MRRDVQVLMATYNGAQFVKAQLESLRAQTMAARLRLLVRDDHSTDGTPDLIRAFGAGALDVTVIEGANVGVVGSFLELMRAADESADFFFLCDQDDVWDADKVAVAVAALEPYRDADLPVLYCGRSVVAAADLRPIGVTDDVPRGPSLANALVQNIAPGHTMAMNRALLSLAARTLVPERVVMHDCWLYLLACAVGRVIFDSVPHATYRLHDDNEAGYQVGRLGRAAGALRRLFTLDRAQWTRQARALGAAGVVPLRLDDQEVLFAFLDQGSVIARLSYLRRFGLRYQRKVRPVAASLLFLAGRYRD